MEAVDSGWTLAVSACWERMAYKAETTKQAHVDIGIAGLGRNNNNVGDV